MTSSSKSSTTRQRRAGRQGDEETKILFSEIAWNAPGGEELVKVKRKYDHAERNIKGTADAALSGQDAALEKKDGKFYFQIEGEEYVEGKDAEELNEEFNKGGLRS